MPNWCQNTLEIKGNEEDLKEFISKAEDGKFTLAAYYPYETEDGEWDYYWCVEAWGTKWDGSEGPSMALVKPGSSVGQKSTEMESDQGSIKISFDTAWGPPVKALIKIANDWKSLDFELIWFEGGMWFAGRLNFDENCNPITWDVDGDNLTEDIVEDLGFSNFYY